MHIEGGIGKLTVLLQIISFGNLPSMVLFSSSWFKWLGVTCVLNDKMSRHRITSIVLLAYG